VKTIFFRDICNNGIFVARILTASGIPYNSTSFMFFEIPEIGLKLDFSVILTDPEKFKPYSYHCLIFVKANPLCQPVNEINLLLNIIDLLYKYRHYKLLPFACLGSFQFYGYKGPKLDCPWRFNKIKIITNDSNR
jgi:hypothetical protein